MTSYSPPVEQLLTRGEVNWEKAWADYQRLGIGPENVPDLIRMLEDLELHRANWDDPRVWAPLHAWRALAQWGAVEAVQPYLNTLARLDGDEADDWIREEAPEFFRRIGAASLPALAGFLADDNQPT